MTSTNVPLPGSVVYELPESPFVEAVITVPCEGHGMTLLACDLLIHVTDTVGVPIIGKGIMNMFGFISEKNEPQPAPLWLRNMVKFRGKAAVQKWYDDVIAMDFAHIVCSHGTPVVDVSHEATTAAVERKLCRYPNQ